MSKLCIDCPLRGACTEEITDYKVRHCPDPQGPHKLAAYGALVDVQMNLSGTMRFPDYHDSPDSKNPGDDWHAMFRLLTTMIDHCEGPARLRRPIDCRALGELAMQPEEMPSPPDHQRLRQAFGDRSA